MVNITKVDCGYWHCLAIDGNHQAWSAGYGTYGELGRSKSDDDVDVFGPVEQEIPYRDISCGLYVSFFIDLDNDFLHSCGKKSLSCQEKDAKDRRAHINGAGPKQVMFFDGVPLKQVECGLNYICALTQEGEIFSWGDNSCK